MRNTTSIIEHLEQLGLSPDEATIFLHMLESPKTQLEVSRATGIARSNVYRIVDGMAQKGLVHEQTTDEGKLIVSARPETLELLVLEQEISTEARRSSLIKLLPSLMSIQKQRVDFGFKTYSGLGGIKQMLWNELKSTSETLLFTSAWLDSATGETWAAKYRAEVRQRGIQVRGIENQSGRARAAKVYTQYGHHYQARFLPEEVLSMKFELSIYNDTIAIYNKVSEAAFSGTEISNPFLAAFMRQVFEQYWVLASE